LTPPPPDIRKVTPVVEETDVLLIDEQPLPSVPERADDETRILSNELSPLDETKLGEELTIGTSSDNVQFIQQQINLLSTVPSDEAITEESNVSHAEVTPDKKNRKRVTWSEKVTDNEDDESSSYQSLIEESSSSEPPSTVTEKEGITIDEPTMVADQQFSTSTSTELQTEPAILSSHPEPQIDMPVVADKQIDSPVSIEPLSELSVSPNHHVPSIDSTENHVDVTGRQTRSSSSSTTSSPFSDSVDQQTVSSDLIESLSNSNDQLTVLPIITSNVVINDHINKEVEALESTETKSKEIIPIDEYKLEFSTQLAKDAQDESEISPAATRSLSSSPIVISPINTLTDSIATRYISSDVYHGYLGEHKQFTQVSHIV
jgi:hypothetical protein